MNFRNASMIAAIVVVLFAAPVAAQQADAWDTARATELEQMRQELFNLLANQQLMLDTYKELGGDDRHFRISIQRAYSIVSNLTAEHLQMLVDANLHMNEVNSTLQSTLSDAAVLARYSTSGKAGSNSWFFPSSNFDPAPQTAGAFHLGDCPADDQIITTGESASLPPGPCNQIDEIPVAPFDTNDGSRTKAEFRLSDVDYAFICPFDTPAPFIIAYEVTFSILNTVIKAAIPVCDQLAAGFNGSLVCTPFVVSVKLAEQLLGYFKYCNGVRRNSDGTAIYVRTGEIFVQSNAHYAALDSRSSDADTKIGELETDVSAEVNAYGSEVSTKLQAGFGDIDIRMDILELRILDNQERTDFTRLNNDEIVREIRIQKARILGDLLNH